MSECEGCEDLRGDVASLKKDFKHARNLLRACDGELKAERAENKRLRKVACTMFEIGRSLSKTNIAGEYEFQPIFDNEMERLRADQC